LKAKGLDRESIRAALHVENRKKCAPPLPDEHVDRTIKNAWMQPDRAAFTQNGRAQVDHHETPHDVSSSDSASEPVFQLVTAPDSFISQYVTYATIRTDAPQEAHEALAFGVLSVLASNVRLPIATSPRG
jgi:hypothetical protein